MTRGEAASILFIGDSFLRSRDGESPFRFIETVWNRYDMIVMNLETAITDNQTPAAIKSVNLVVPPGNLSWLEPYRDKLIVTLANNHVYDYGNNGFLETCEHLQRFGIRFAAPDAPYPITVAGERWIFYPLCKEIQNEFQQQWNNPANFSDTALPADANHVAFIHWGEEHVLLPTPGQINLAHRLLDCGFRAVVGHHSHAPQGMIVNEDCAICYSLGNFNFTQFDVPPKDINRLGCMVAMSFRRPGMRVEKIPYIIDSNWSPRPVDSPHMNQFFHLLNEELTSYYRLRDIRRKLRYHRHASSTVFWGNVFYGWIPRINRGGGKQLFKFLRWLFSPGTLIRLPFLFCRDDRLWRSCRRLLATIINEDDRRKDT